MANYFDGVLDDELDLFPVGPSTSIRAAARFFKVERLKVVPPGCTKYIQAPDTDWNHPFKASIRREYEEWINLKDRPHTSGGNPRAPDMDVYLRWIFEAWNALPDEAIAKSFKNCDITTANDGSEDHKIACFRPTGAAPMGLDILRKAREESDIELIMPEEEDLEENILNGLDDMVID
ncbi:pogo transposable element with KRAB domain [Ditylenchus destructor]|uniref:Pogo transposable element with KRAB domain n=1 Tax=Ditylenchus destructor TaxID=166010 RepID=A0AAD4MVX3_9BILA|nr:pogo transposable element with KRAB domain [Ditylenchus destructor]